MKAEIMFKRLGYEIYRSPLNEEFFLTYRKEIIIDGWLHIVDIEFNTKKKTLKVSEFGYDYTLSVQETKAICKQIQELGWLDE